MDREDGGVADGNMELVAGGGPDGAVEKRVEVGRVAGNGGENGGTVNGRGTEKQW